MTYTKEDLRKLTVVQLKQLCKENRIVGINKKKEELISKLLNKLNSTQPNSTLPTLPNSTQPNSALPNSTLPNSTPPNSALPNSTPLALANIASLFRDHPILKRCILYNKDLNEYVVIEFLHIPVIEKVLKKRWRRYRMLPATTGMQSYLDGRKQAYNLSFKDVDGFSYLPDGFNPMSAKKNDVTILYHPPTTQYAILSKPYRPSNPDWKNLEFNVRIVTYLYCEARNVTVAFLKKIGRN